MSDDPLHRPHDPRDDAWAALSSMADGEASADAQERCLAMWSEQSDARARWRQYQLIGDVLRSRELARDDAHDAAFLAALRTRMPSPRGDPAGAPRAMIIDSWFDNYVGVVMLVRVVDGSLSKGERIRLMATDAVHGIEQLGVFTPKSEPRDVLRAGEVGFVIAGIKELHHAKVGDTVTLEKKLPNNAGPASEPLPGFKEIQPQVFAGLYPVEASEYESLRDALDKLKLNDSSLRFEPEVSQALGFGFRCGFLGLLHMHRC